MFKLKIEPFEPIKLTVEEHKKYMTAKDTIKQFSINKDKLKGFINIESAIDELKSFVQNYRSDLKQSKLQYENSFNVKHRGWSKLLKEVKSSSIRQSFNDESIKKNLRHMTTLHKDLFKKDEKSYLTFLKHCKDTLKLNIQEMKREKRTPRLQRQERVIQDVGERIRYNKAGGVIYSALHLVPKRGEKMKGKKVTEMGVFLKFLKSKEKKIVYNQKSPTTKDNYIGVEIEFFCDLDNNDLGFKLYEAGLGKYVCLKSDGSIRPDDRAYAHELCVLVKEKEYKDIIKQVCDVLSKSNSKVNKSCGLHVHLDMRNREAKIAFHNLVTAQNILYAMNPHSRQTGTYCKRVETKDFAIAKTGDRYFGINAASHGKHNTIEIRLHAGTIMESKINNWIELLLIITNKKTEMKAVSASLNSFVKQYKIEDALATYMGDRIAKFFGDENKEAEERGVA